MLGNDLTAYHAGIEVEAPLIIGANQGDVMYFVKV
jgi:hypothetical protein